MLVAVVDVGRLAVLVCFSLVYLCFLELFVITHLGLLKLVCLDNLCGLFLIFGLFNRLRCFHILLLDVISG